MGETSQLDVAVLGDTIRGADLQASIDSLLVQSSALDALVMVATDVGEVQALGRVQQDLRSAASSLVNVQIALLAGEAKITAVHINGATQFAEKVIAKIADVRKKVQTIGKLIDFFAVVLTGSGTKILDAAISLKASLDTD